jgi:hypothetical protein
MLCMVGGSPHILATARGLCREPGASVIISVVVTNRGGVAGPRPDY